MDLTFESRFELDRMLRYQLASIRSDTEGNLLVRYGPTIPSKILTENADEGVELKCSTNYLLTLLLELHKARAQPLLQLTGLSSEESHLRRLQFLAHEISRLLQQPDLFVSSQVRARFLSMLSADAELHFTQACKNLLVNQELRNLERRSRKALTRTPYKDGSVGWENFLLDGAPGSGHASHRTAPTSIFQVVPAVGMRIIADYDREEVEIVRYVEEVSDPSLYLRQYLQSH